MARRPCHKKEGKREKTNVSLDEAGRLLREGRERAVREDVEEGRLAKALVLDPHPLQVEVGRHELVRPVALQRALAEVQAYKGQI